MVSPLLLFVFVLLFSSFMTLVLSLSFACFGLLYVTVVNSTLSYCLTFNFLFFFFNLILLLYLCSYHTFLLPLVFSSSVSLGRPAKCLWSTDGVSFPWNSTGLSGSRALHLGVEHLVFLGWGEVYWGTLVTQKVASSSVQVSVLSYFSWGRTILCAGVECVFVCLPMFYMLMCVIVYSNCISVRIFVGVGGL